MTKYEFVFEDKTIQVGFDGTWNEALTDLIKIGKVSPEDIANIKEVKETEYRIAS